MSIADRVMAAITRWRANAGGGDVLPLFRYHPDPVATRAIAVTDETCASCHQARGYRVTGHYGPQTYSCICPWCVADGKAARRLILSFVHDSEDELPARIWDELTHRTPGYESWQGERWLTHCGDACAFHGDVPPEDISRLPADVEARFLAENDWIDDWDDLKSAYTSGNSDVALYTFVCLHCRLVRIGIDRS